MTVVSVSDLAAVMGCSEATARVWVQPLADAMAAYGISEPEVVAMFLAQLGHESGGLRWTSEIWGPTATQLRYEGRKDLGNVHPGDGSRFRGHGPIQITGRRNHARARDRLRAKLGPEVPDFEAFPEQLCVPKWGAYSAADFWDAHKLGSVRGVEVVTRVINGGLNGLDDRRARFVRALRILGDGSWQT